MEKLVKALQDFFSPTTLRSMLTLLGFSALTAAYLYSTFYMTTPAVSTEVYMPLVALMVGFWFAERKNGNGT